MSTKTTAYGSITIVDITDIGEFSVQPESNMPLSVIYDPDQNTYTPSWSQSSPLRVTPVVYYAGKQLDLKTTTGLQVSWQRKDGGNDAADIDGAHEQVENNVLKVSSYEPLIAPACSSGLLTYICTATYTEPESQTPLTAKGQITFSLVKNAAKVKKCSITGENVFKYNTNGVLQGAEFITLSGTVSNVSISRWLYKNSDGIWTSYPVTAGNNTSNTGAKIKIYADKEDGVFVNDVATIRLNTNDSTVYDICTVTKLRDGAAGNSTVAAVLTNDDQWIACDSNGTPVDGAFDQAYSKIAILEGGVDVTDDWNIDCIPDGATCTFDQNTYTCTVTGIDKNSANVRFECTKDGYTTIYKNFSLTKLVAAKDGVSPTVYSVEPSAYVINRTIGGVHTPNTVMFTAYSKTGNSDKEEYAGRFLVYVDDVLNYTSEDGMTSHLYSFTDGLNVKSVRCELYKDGGGGDPLDSQTIVVTSDGATGADGKPGEKGDGATNVIIGNQADVIPCDKDGNVLSNMTIHIPYTGYKGIERVDCKFRSHSALPSGMTFGANVDASSSGGGNVSFDINKGATLGGKDSGTITLTFTCNGTDIIHYYQWSKSIQATNGENAVLFQVYAPGGNIITNGENNVELETHLVDGSREITSGITYTWAKYQNGTYTTVSGQSGNSLTIDAADVSGYASYRCTAKYNDKDYVAYYSVFDKNDPVQAHIYSSVGTQILNNQGHGAIYTKIFRNGEEIDAIKSERFLTEAPEGSKGDFYYHLDKTAKRVTLKKYNGTAWDDATGDDLPKAAYSYTFRDKDGNITTYNGRSTVTDKVFYIDGSFITKKIIIDVEVEV